MEREVLVRMADPTTTTDVPMPKGRFLTGAVLNEAYYPGF